MTTKTLTLTKDKEVVHSVRYGIKGNDFQFQVYVPKMLLAQLGYVGAWPKELEITLGTKERAGG